MTGLIMVVIGVIGVSMTAPTVIRKDTIPDTDYNIQSPPNEVEFRNPMVDTEVVSVMFIIVGWAIFALRVVYQAG